MLYEGMNINTAQRAEPSTIPPPIGGLNGRDALSAMDNKDAYEMDNMLPGTTSCKVRQGCAIRATLGSSVFSLDTYAGGGNGNDQLLALDDDGNWTEVIAVPDEVKKTGIVGREIVSLMFSTVADDKQFLIACTEGEDVPWSYDGTTATDLAITGLNEDASFLNFVCSYMGRLFWATKDRLGFYYLIPGAIQGAAEWFDLGQLAHRGGHVVAIATYSEDAGDGPNDYIVFITSKGEYLMFIGTDPGDASAWAIVGRYRSSALMSRRSVLRYAGDLVVLTEEGALQFSQIRKLADTRFELTALSSKLGNILLNNGVYRDTFGWNLCLYPRAGWLIISVPHSLNLSGKYHQFVMNTTTQAWCRFESAEWNALCWATANGNLYFGRYDGTVRQGDVNLDDNGKAIDWDVKQAYNYFSSFSYKHFKWAQFLLKSEAPAAVSSNLSVDYKEIKPTSVTGNLEAGPGAIWDVSFWDEDYWGIGPYTQRFIAPYGRYGVAASHWLSGSLKGATLEWFATEHVFEKAKGLLG